MAIVIAIDGTSASGKGTIAKAVAEHFFFSYLDTGLIYRSVAKLAMERTRGKLHDAIAIDVAKKFSVENLQMKGLRTNLIGSVASKIAEIKEVRDLLYDFQKEFPKKYGDCVLDGRDIGTKIFPNAKVKLYVDAALSIRAKRRFDELVKNSNDIELNKIIKDLKDRDLRDSNRKNGPLKISEDAHLLDTSELSIQASIEKAIEIVRLQLS